MLFSFSSSWPGNSRLVPILSKTQPHDVIYRKMTSQEKKRQKLDNWGKQCSLRSLSSSKPLLYCWIFVEIRFFTSRSTFGTLTFGTRKLGFSIFSGNWRKFDDSKKFGKLTSFGKSTTFEKMTNFGESTNFDKSKKFWKSKKPKTFGDWCNKLWASWTFEVICRCRRFQQNHTADSKTASKGFMTSSPKSIFSHFTILPTLS